VAAAVSAPTQALEFNKGDWLFNAEHGTLHRISRQGSGRTKQYLDYNQQTS